MVAQGGETAISYGTIYTEYDSCRVEVHAYAGRGSWVQRASIELRPASGTGYYCSYYLHDNGEEEWDYGSGACESWNWNGAFSRYQKWYEPGERTQTNHFSGTAVDNLQNGVETREYINVWDPSQAYLYNNSGETNYSETFYENGVDTERTDSEQLFGIFAAFQKDSYSLQQYDWRD